MEEINKILHSYTYYQYPALLFGTTYMGTASFSSMIVVLIISGNSMGGVSVSAPLVSPDVSTMMAFIGVNCSKRTVAWHSRQVEETNSVNSAFKC